LKIWSYLGHLQRSLEIPLDHTAGGADITDEEIGCLKSLSAVLKMADVGTPHPDEIVQGF
jgi:hypothetical protein